MGFLGGEETCNANTKSKPKACTVWGSTTGEKLGYAGPKSVLPPFLSFYWRYAYVKDFS